MLHCYSLQLVDLFAVPTLHFRFQKQVQVKVHRGSVSIASLLQEVRLLRRSIYPQEKSPPLHLLNKRRRGTHSRFDNFGEEKIILTLQEFEPRILQPLAYSLFPVRS